METEIVDYTLLINEILLNQVSTNEVLESCNTALVQLNGYLYILLFVLIGVGILFLFYRFLKIFL